MRLDEILVVYDIIGVKSFAMYGSCNYNCI